MELFNGHPRAASPGQSAQRGHCVGGAVWPHFRSWSRAHCWGARGALTLPPPEVLRRRGALTAAVRIIATRTAVSHPSKKQKTPQGGVASPRDARFGSGAPPTGREKDKHAGAVLSVMVP